jgi:hypothetical protein
VKVHSFFAADATDRETAAFAFGGWLLLNFGRSGLAAAFGLAIVLRLLLTLFGDLGDEETFLADARLSFLFRGRFDRVLHLKAGVVHRFVLECRHCPSPIKKKDEGGRMRDELQIHAQASTRSIRVRPSLCFLAGLLFAA